MAVDARETHYPFPSAELKPGRDLQVCLYLYYAVPLARLRRLFEQRGQSGLLRHCTCSAFRKRRSPRDHAQVLLAIATHHASRLSASISSTTHQHSRTRYDILLATLDALRPQERLSSLPRSPVPLHPHITPTKLPLCRLAPPVILRLPTRKGALPLRLLGCRRLQQRTHPSRTQRSLA